LARKIVIGRTPGHLKAKAEQIMSQPQTQPAQQGGSTSTAPQQQGQSGGSSQQQGSQPIIRDWAAF
jgi:hypothetical protein